MIIFLGGGFGFIGGSAKIETIVQICKSLQNIGISLVINSFLKQLKFCIWTKIISFFLFQQPVYRKPVHYKAPQQNTVHKTCPKQTNIDSIILGLPVWASWKPITMVTIMLTTHHGYLSVDNCSQVTPVVMELSTQK